MFSANNVFSTLGIPSDIRFTLAHFTFGTPVCTLSLLVVVLLVRQAAFFMVILGTVGTVVTFGTPVAFLVH